MIDYVWRVPVLFGIIACSALVLFATSVIGSIAIRRRRSILSVLAAAVTLTSLATVAAIALRASAVRIARTHEISVSYIDPGAIGYVTPVLFAGFAFIIGRWALNGEWTSRSALLFYLWLLAFTVANVVNRCAPGWCAAFGFPFAWQSWSDHIMETGDDEFNRFMSAVGTLFVIIGGLLDLLLFVAVAGILKHRTIRRRLTIR